MILKNSALSEHKGHPGYCADSENLRKENNEAFQQTSDNVAPWRGNRSLDTPFLKRWVLCRSVIADLGQSCVEAVTGKRRDTNNFATLELVIKRDEDTSGRREVAWQPSITEELLSLLDHIETWQEVDTGSWTCFCNSSVLVSQMSNSKSGLWHAHMFFTTASPNMDQLRSEIPVDRLPETTQDAITITRMLGVR
ncbi:hypothetical protein DL98DRAFT_542627 [Cadophora sp. DSE1049]|nr:hypothetical protein DL98DRAFT_542627 [Cadophora sp. DSE1049]